MRRSADLRKFLLVFLLLLTSCRHEPLREVFKRTEKLMGTFVEVCVVTADHEKAEAAINAAFRVMREAEGLMSVDLPESEISRLNAAGSLVVSPATFDCVEKALEAGRLMSGAFDISSAPLTKLWEEAGRLGKLPARSEIDAVRRRVGYEKIGLDPIKRRVTLAPGMRIDLGTAARAYGADMAVDLLRRRGITSAIINAGGDLYLLGRAVNGGPWRVKIPNPFASDASSFIAAAGLKDQACVSGRYQDRGMAIEGKFYSRVIDPRSGWPIAPAAGVTVVASTTVMANALAAGICVSGPEEGIKLAKRLSGVYVFVVAGDKDNVNVSASASWQKVSWKNSGQGE